MRTAHYATVSLSLSTPPIAAKTHQHGPLHALGKIFRALGIGAIYALAIGTPFMLIGLGGFFGVRRLRRRREDALLSQT